MTDEEFFQKQWEQSAGFFKGCMSVMMVAIAAIVIIVMLAGCKSIEYVPIEVMKTVTVHHTDTVEKVVENNSERETIIREARPEDSLLLARLGIKLQDNERMLILLRRELAETKNELKEKHAKDSIKTDTIHVPYPVERKLTKWEQVCVDYGKLSFGATAAFVILIIILFLRWLTRHRS